MIYLTEQPISLYQFILAYTEIADLISELTLFFNANLATWCIQMAEFPTQPPFVDLA